MEHKPAPNSHRQKCLLERGCSHHPPRLRLERLEERAAPTSLLFAVGPPLFELSEIGTDDQPSPLADGHESFSRLGIPYEAAQEAESTSAEAEEPQ